MIRYLLIALFFFVIGGINLVSQLNKRKNCNVLCSGTIVEVQRRTRKGRRRFTPIYEFTAGGKHIRGDGDVLSTTRRKNIRSEISLRFYTILKIQMNSEYPAKMNYWYYPSFSSYLVSERLLWQLSITRQIPSTMNTVK